MVVCDASNIEWSQYSHGGRTSSDRELLEKAAQKAYQLMRYSGFKISSRLEVHVDPELSFMGYSTQKKEGHAIIVSGAALGSGFLEVLLIHEMSHICRSDAQHPSHNPRLLSQVIHDVASRNSLTESYQFEVIQNAINHIQDIYADDIVFQVLDKTRITSAEQMQEFFLTWINEEPIPQCEMKDRWQNVDIMLTNCFAASNLQRHDVKDSEAKLERRIQSYLSKTDDVMKRQFAYFRGYMTGLEKEVDEEKFKKGLSVYLEHVIEAARTR
jgi:ketosteroid isomerase-like protein